MQTIEIDISRAESLAKELHGFFPSRLKNFPAAIVIAAAASIESRLRAGTASPHRKWPEALAALASELPGNLEDSKRELYRAAAVALGGVAIVEQYEREAEAKQEIAAASAKLSQIQQAPFEERAARVQGEARAHALSVRQQAWNVDFDRIERDAKETIKRLWGSEGLSPFDESTLNVAFMTIQKFRILREIKAEMDLQ